MNMNRNALSLAVVSAVFLAACGGSGGGTKPNIDPPPPAPTTCQDRNATNFGGPLPCTYRYSGPAMNHLIPTNVDRAHASGFTGEGVKIGILDSGANRSLPSLNGAVAWYRSYLPTDPNDPNYGDPNSDDPYGHGSFVAQMAAGRASGQFPGGVAPDASLYVARICRDSDGSCLGGQVLQQAARDMLAQGVRIFNHSFAGGAWQSGVDYTGTYNSLVTPEALAANALLVWGVGNNGNSSQPSGPAALPVQFSNLRNNWIAVAAGAVNSSGEVTSLASFSSKCGVAAQWCITAPGVVSAFASENGAYVSSQGTSFAAPQVAGAAALVSQAFPWMGGDLLQLSILTTATDLGAAGVDEVFGWGLLNAEAAVRGPGQFAFGDVTANVNRSGSWEWSNDIGGAGGLTKTGIGRLLLSGDNSYSGATFVNGGALALSGTVRSNVTAQSGGTFESQGGTIHGNYTAQSGSTTAIALGGPLTVNGSAAVAGTLRLLPAAGTYVVGGTETLLTATNGISGTFGSITYDSSVFYTGTLNYSANELTINLTAKTAQKVASDAGHAAGATANGAAHFDAVRGLADQWAITGTGNAAFLADAAKVLNSGTEDEAIKALTALSGEVHGTARNALLATSGQVARTLGNRVDDLAHGSESGGWVSVQAASGDLQQSGYTDADTRTSGVLAGVDVRFDNGSLGGVIGAGKSVADLGVVGGEFEADRVLAGVYGRVDGEGWYATGSLTREWLDVDVDRQITGDAVTADRHDKVDQLRVEVGKAGNFSPFVAARAVAYRMGGFAEQGNLLGLMADSDTHHATYGELGARYTTALGNGTFTASARYQRLLSGERTGFEAAFVGSPTIGFTAEGQQLRRNAGVLGASYTGSIKDGWVWFVDGEVEAGSGVNGQRISAGIRGSF